MPTYDFNPHQHVKIWLSKNPKVFLNQENQLRLVKMRQINPQDDIHFAYDSSLLNHKAKSDLASFCQKHQLSPIDINQLDKSKLSQEEKNLLSAYKTEISALFSGGNLAVASDLVRWLSPLYNLGTYSDFDVTIDTRSLLKEGKKQTVSVSSPILLNIGSITQLGIEFPVINNDTIAIVNEAAALEKIQKLQRSLYLGATQHMSITLSDSIETQKNRLKDDLFNIYKEQFPYTYMNEKFLSLYTKALAENINQQNPSFKTAQALIKNEVRPTKFRNFIQTSTKNNDSFINSPIAKPEPDELPLFSLLPPARPTKKDIAEKWRQYAKSQLTWFNYFMLPSSDYNHHKKMSGILDDDQILTMARENLEKTIIMNSVIQTSGPVMLLNTLLDHAIYSKEQLIEQVLPDAFENYNLGQNFHSKNAMKPHSTAAEMMKLMNSETGENCDLSWLSAGESKIKSKEELMTTSATKIQKLFRDRKAILPHLIKNKKHQIENHITKIEADLNGWFGFYRKHQRQEKVKALKGILTHFNESSFNVTNFKDSLATYQSKDITARLTTSKTKGLIDQLGLFSHQIESFNLAKQNSSGEEIVYTSVTP